MTCCTDLQPKQSITLTQGDDSNALGGAIVFNMTADMDMTGWYAILQLQNFQWRYDNLQDGGFEWVITREITAQLEPGLHRAGMKIFDSDDLCKTVIDDIPVYVNEQVVANPEA